MKHILLSCFNDSTNDELPVALDWAKTLLNLFPNKYRITVLLHGECIKYSLKKNNRRKKIIKKLHNDGVRFRVCKYCLENDGFSIDDVIRFIKPIKFSVDYIVKCQSRGIHIINDEKN